MISAGRDSVVLVWEFTADASHSSKGKGKEVANLVKTIPILERVEAAGLLPNDLNLVPGGSSSERGLYFFTAGEKGTIKIWDAQKGIVVTSLNELHSESEEEMEAIRNAVMTKEGILVSVFDMLRRVPRRVLMLLKLNDLVRCEAGHCKRFS